MAEHHVQLATKDTLFYVKYSDEAIWHERFPLGEHYSTGGSEAGHVVVTPDGHVYSAWTQAG